MRFSIKSDLPPHCRVNYYNNVIIHVYFLQKGTLLNIWFLLWFVLSVILLGATTWSTFILFQQKRAWRAYAKAKGLEFDNGTFFGPCTMDGVIGDYNLSFFTAVQQYEDDRKNRQLTVMQVTANVPFVDAVAAGTKMLLPFMQSLDATTPHNMEGKNWNKAFSIRSRNKASVGAYLTKERVSILNQILSMPNADILILLDEKEGVFRFETSNPLKNEKQIDAVISKLIARIKKLQTSVEEQNRLASLMSLGNQQESSAGLVKAMPDEMMQLADGLELEEEPVEEIKEESEEEIKEENPKSSPQ